MNKKKTKKWQDKYIKIKKSEYQDIADCIKTDQVPERTIAEYFEDKPFFRWFQKKYR